jgi:hypothetical protein
MRNRTLHSLVLGALVGAAIFAPLGLDVAEAAPPAKKAAPAGQPAALSTSVKLSPEGLRWGQSRKEVIKVYEAAIEKDYKKAMKEAQPGIQMTRVRHEIDQKKLEFRLSWSEFDGKPTALDSSPFSVEYAHENGEAILSSRRQGRLRYMFFMKNRLWKIVDLYKMSRWGKDYPDAIARLETRLDVKGRKLKADPGKGRSLDEVDFADDKTHLRVMHYSKTKIAIAYVDKSVESNLANLRKPPKPKEEGEALDPSVKSILRVQKDPGPPPNEKSAPKK